MTTAAKTTSRRHLEGTVISNKMQKTAIIKTTTLAKHPKYGKFIRKFKKLKIHDEKSECNIGDRVEVIESKPISREKRFRLVRIIERARIAE